MREVTQFVLAEQADGSGKPDLDAQIDEGVLQPLRALKTVVNELAMTAE